VKARHKTKTAKRTVTPPAPQPALAPPTPAPAVVAAAPPQSMLARLWSSRW
jgi:hypothetical protein